MASAVTGVEEAVKEALAKANENEAEALGMPVERDWDNATLKVYQAKYIDDMLHKFNLADASLPLWAAADFKTALGARFDIKDSGVCAWALGMPVERDWDNATLKVHQAKYIDDMLHKFNLADAYAVSIPAEAAKQVLRYLKGTKTLRLTFSGGKADGLLHGYCDADWAGDVVLRRSTTGFVFMLGGAAVSWKSQLQATVALSTAEAENMALCAAVCEALFLRELCCAHQSEATVIFEDNQSCIALTRNPMTHGRSKHIAIKYHFTREKVLSGEAAIEYCPTANMVADALTKALGRLKHAEFAMQMLGA
eukprot:jgi/Tetstr1/428091/TSEL_018146.t1